MRAGFWPSVPVFCQTRLVSGDLDGIRRVVVIPVLAEEERLFNTLKSLERNRAEELAETLVICVVNNRAEPHARPEQVADNQRTLAHLDNLVHGRPAATQPRIDPGSLRLAYVDASSPGREIGPKMGVGEGRRIGLDLGLSVLTENADDPGLLICLDADTLVEADYLGEVQKHFETRGLVGRRRGLRAHPADRGAATRCDRSLREFPALPRARSALGALAICLSHHRVHHGEPL